VAYGDERRIVRQELSGNQVTLFTNTVIGA